MFMYPWQVTDVVDVYSDTDWAGCPKTRKSTSGGCVMLGSHLIKSWSSTQSSVSLSSGEAEFYGVVKAAGMGLGYSSLLADVGIRVPLRVWTDSTATIGICGRQGLGKLRHIDTQCLWIQQRVRDGTLFKRGQRLQLPVLPVPSSDLQFLRQHRCAVPHVRLIGRGSFAGRWSEASYRWLEPVRGGTALPCCGHRRVHYRQISHPNVV